MWCAYFLFCILEARICQGENCYNYYHLTHRVGRGVCDLFNGLLVLSDHSMDCDVMWTMCGREGVFPGPQSVQREIKL